MSGNVAERHHVSWHKKHMEPLSICEQCCNTSKIKCGKAIRFFHQIQCLDGFWQPLDFLFPSLFCDLFGCWEHRCLFLVFTSPWTDFLRVGDEDVSCCQQMFHFLLWFLYLWLSIIGLTWRTESWLGSRNFLPEDPLNVLIWNFSRVSGGLCCENANRIRVACARSPNCETVSCVSNI